MAAAVALEDIPATAETVQIIRDQAVQMVLEAEAEAVAVHRKVEIMALAVAAVSGCLVKAPVEQKARQANIPVQLVSVDQEVQTELMELTQVIVEEPEVLMEVEAVTENTQVMVPMAL